MGPIFSAALSRSKDTDTVCLDISLLIDLIYSESLKIFTPEFWLNKHGSQIISKDSTLEDIPFQCRTHVWAQVWSESHSNCHQLQYHHSGHTGHS